MPPPPLSRLSPISPTVRSRHVSLPEQVEKLIAIICKDQAIDPPDYKARAELSRLGELASMQILRRIAASRVRSFSAFVMHMARYSQIAMARNAEALSTHESGCFSGPPVRDFDSPTSSEIESGDMDWELIDDLQSTPPAHNPSGNLVNSPQMFSTPTSNGTLDTVRGRIIFDPPSPQTPRGNSVNSPRYPPGTPVQEMARANLGHETFRPSDADMDSLRANLSPQMIALGEMEFRRAFLILSYVGRKKLEDVVSVELIKFIKCLTMKNFESVLWREVGLKCIEYLDRRKNVDWDTTKTHVYHCHVDLNGYATFKGPFVENTETHLQRVLGDENILQVKFAEYNKGDKSVDSSHVFQIYHSIYQRVAEQGIVLGLRRYHFFVYKDGGKEEKKKSGTDSAVRCYFVRTNSLWAMDQNKPYFLSDKNINTARLSFMHINTVTNLAKYMVRFSLILSKTLKLDIDWSSVNVVKINDIPCKHERGNIVEGAIHTDGTGLISEDLAIKCPNNIFKGSCLNTTEDQNINDGGLAMVGPPSLRKQHSHNKEPPLLMQVRLYHKGSTVKGTLLIDKRLPPNTICVRPSMIKVETDPAISHILSQNSLEIVSTSYRPKKTHLSRYLIALLHYGGVPADVFLGLLANALENATEGLHNRRAALSVAVNHGGMDDNSLSARMIFSGIPLTEPYLQSRLNSMMDEDKKSLKGGKIPITDCFYLMGTADPSGTLRPDEVCVILENGQVSGNVLVYKHPGLHFGDIHVLKATYNSEIEKVVGNSKFAIFFPTNGPRSLADEMANSDFDGDMYWVSRNPELLKHFKQSKPWVPPEDPKENSKKKAEPFSLTDFADAERERVLFGEYLKTRFKPSFAIGAAADCWLVYMDRFLTPGVPSAEKDLLKGKMDQLVNIYYDAVDAPKTGKKVEVPGELKARLYPHYMGRDENSSYKSKSILGVIHDMVESFQEQKAQSNEVTLLDCFSGEVPEYCITLWRLRYQDYLGEMSQTCQKYRNDKDKEKEKSIACQDIILKYKRLLYGGAEEFEQSTRSKEEIFNEALAIYQITYKYAQSKNVATKYDQSKNVAKCGFAWRVAGHALCQLYVQTQQGDSPILCSQLALHEILGWVNL